MFVKKPITLLAIAMLIASVAGFNAFAQKKVTKPSKPFDSNAKTKNYRKKSSAPRTISFGILNGKALSLVKPEYPRTALATNVKGNVRIHVLINEDGKVVDAKVLSGHPFLVPGSLKAARESTFAPIRLEEQPVRVSGFILFKYLGNTMNWLELGFAAESRQALIESLPPGFEEERTFLRDIQPSFPDDIGSLDTAWAMVRGKLGSNEKALWLIEVGRLLSELTKNHWDVELKAESLTKLRALSNSCPENVSENLRVRLNDLAKPQSPSEFSENLGELADRLFALGV